MIFQSVFFLKAKLILWKSQSRKLEHGGDSSISQGIDRMFHTTLCTQSPFLTSKYKLLQNLVPQPSTCLPSNIYVPIPSFSSLPPSKIFLKTSNLIRYFHYMVHFIPVVSCKSPTFNLRPRWGNISFETSCFFRGHCPIL